MVGATMKNGFAFRSFGRCLIVGESALALWNFQHGYYFWAVAMVADILSDVVTLGILQWMALEEKFRD